MMLTMGTGTGVGGSYVLLEGWGKPDFADIGDSTMTVAPVLTAGRMRHELLRLDVAAPCTLRS